MNRFKLLSLLVLFCLSVAKLAAVDLIEKKYQKVKKILGQATSEVRLLPDGVGHCRHYEKGSIYSHPNHGTWEVHGQISTKWHSLGSQSSWLGYPKSDEMKSQDGVRYSVFENGYIVWTQQKGAYAIGVGSFADKTDSFVDFAKLTDTHCGNLKVFHDFIKEQYGIDLREAVISRPGVAPRNIRGWHFPNFRTTKSLNGNNLTRSERLIMTVAQVFLMQWHLKDLKNNGKERREQLDKYCQGKFEKALKSNLKWKYPKWCSEFASWVYRRSGLQLDDDWCIRDVEDFVKVFKKVSSYYKFKNIDLTKSPAPVNCGDYLHTNDHSMLVLGMKLPNTIYIVHGNVGSGEPQANTRSVNFGTRSLRDTALVGFGKR